MLSTHPSFQFFPFPRTYPSLLKFFCLSFSGSSPPPPSARMPFQAIAPEFSCSFSICGPFLSLTLPVQRCPFSFPRPVSDPSISARLRLTAIDSHPPFFVPRYGFLPSDGPFTSISPTDTESSHRVWHSNPRPLLTLTGRDPLRLSFLAFFLLSPFAQPNV